MYKIFMLIALPLLAIAWIAYALWMRRECKLDAQRPKPVSEKLQKRRNEVADWAKKMAQYKPPKRKNQSESDQNKTD